MTAQNAPTGAMLAALEAIQQEYDEKAKNLPFELKFSFKFERVTATQCKIDCRVGDEKLWYFIGCDMMKEIAQIQSELMQIIDPLVAICERAKERNVEIIFKNMGTAVMERHPPIYRATWKIKVGEYTKKETSRDPRVDLLILAGKEAPLLN